MAKLIQNSEFKIQNSKNSASRAQTMAELMRSAKTTFVTPRKGDAVSGIITKLTRSEILVDINAKTEAIVLEKDRKILYKILSSLKVGDEVVVKILNPEGDMGNPVVSIRKFIDDMVWERLMHLHKDQEALDVKVDSATRGGFLVTTLDDISGFLPNSHASAIENPQRLIGKNIKTVILELNRELHKIIFSQKQVLSIDDFKKYIKDLKIGQKIDAIISNITSFGIFLYIPVQESKVVEGFIHISEISWENISEVPENFKVSQKIEALITGFDEDSRRVLLSIKRLTADPFEEKLKEYPIDKKTKGEVTKIIPSGVLLDLGEGIVGIIKKDKIPPNVSYQEGAELNVMVSSVDRKKHRLVVVPVLLEKPIGYR